MEKTNGTSGDAAVLQEILASLKTIQQENTHLAAAVDAINGRVNILAGVKQVKDMTVDPTAVERNKQYQTDPIVPTVTGSTPTSPDLSAVPESGRRSSVTSKIILTSYPGQAGVDPLPMNWGHKDPSLRGPVVVSRNPSSIRRRNAIGAHGGSYAICTYKTGFPLLFHDYLVPGPWIDCLSDRTFSIQLRIRGIMLVQSRLVKNRLPPKIDVRLESG